MKDTRFASVIIQQCVKCYSLRNPETPNSECVTCREKLGVRTVETQPVLLMRTHHDIPTSEPLAFPEFGGRA